MFYDVFIRRPRMAMVISILISLVGVIAVQIIPVAQYPDIAPPTVQVTASYSGADAEAVEAAVAQPIESVVNGVDGMKYMKSTSSSDGSYSLTVAFGTGDDPDIAAVSVQNRVSGAEASLPAEVRATGVTVEKAATDILQAFALYSPDGSMSELFLQNYGTINVIDELKRVPGVGDASIFGAQQYAMRIWIDPQKLESYGLTTGDVIAAINAQNQQAAAGRIGAAPVADDQSLQLTVTVKGRLAQEDEFGAIVLKTTLDGAFVRIRDVARVELGARSSDTGAHYREVPAAIIGIYLSPGSNAVAVAEAVDAKMAELAERFPEGMVHESLFSSADFVNTMIEEVIETLVIAFVLVGFVVFFFLGRIRPTIIPLIAVPVSILGGIAIMMAFGFSANMISLLALVLAIGIVVDDAILVVENVERIMSEEPELTPIQATKKAMRQIATSIITTTLVLLSVFVPVAFLPGSSGVLYREFAIAITGATVVSTINALTLSPALSAMILRPGKPMAVMRGISWGIEKTTNGFTRLVRGLLRVAVFSLVAVFGFGIATGWFVQTLPGGFVPDEDRGYIMVLVQLPAGASLNRTAAAMDDAVEIIKRDPAVTSIGAVRGFDFLGGGSAPNSGIMFVRLKPFEERPTPDLWAPSVVGRLWGGLGPIPEAMFIPVIPPSISGLGQVGGVEMIIEALEGQPPAEMAATSLGLIVGANGLPEVASAYSSFDASTPQVRLKLDREKAQALGINVGDVFSALQATLGGFYVNDFNRFGRTWSVYIQADEPFRNSIDDISRIKIRTASGDMAPLSAFAEAELAVGPRFLTRYNNYRAVSLTASAAPGLGSGEVITALDDLAAGTLPAGYATEWSGLALEQIESSGQTVIVLSLALIFAYLFLVAMYESWVIPIAVLLSVSVAMLGAVTAVWLAGLAFDLYAQIALVVLISLSAKNAILMNSFALDCREEGMTVREAAATAARLRFRPIMMTSFAFVMGILPLTLATGPGAGAMVAVGVPVLFGMLAAALVGVLTIPMLFLVFQWLREKTGWKPGKLREE